MFTSEPAAGPTTLRAGRTWQASSAAFVLLAIPAVVCIVYLGRTWTFFYDEWGIVLYRREGGVDAFFAPHNGHLQAVAVAVYRALFSLVGIEDYWPYQVPVVAAHVSVAALVFLYGRRRLHPVLALSAAVLLLFMGEAWEVLFWGVNATFAIPMACLLGVLVLRDAERWRRAEPVAATVLTLVAMASSGVGIAVAATVAADAALSRRWRSLAGVVAALSAYLLWFVAYRDSATTPASLRAVPGALPQGDLGARLGAVDVDGAVVFIAHAAQASLFSLFASHVLLPATLALVLTAALLAVLGVRFWRMGTTRGWALLTGALTLWSLLGLSRGEQPPNSSRYLYVGGVFVLLLALEAAPRLDVRPLVLVVAGVLSAVVAALGVLDLYRVSSAAGQAFEVQAAALGEVLCASPASDPARELDPDLLPGVTAGPLRAAATDLGIPDGVDCDRGQAHQAGPSTRWPEARTGAWTIRGPLRHGWTPAGRPDPSGGRPGANLRSSGPAGAPERTSWSSRSR